MRIGMILDAPFPPDRRVEHEARTLLERGYEVALFHINWTSGVLYQRARRAESGQGSDKELTSQATEEYEAGQDDGTAETVNHFGLRNLGDSNSVFEQKVYRGIELYGYSGGRVLYKSSALACELPLFERWMAPVLKEFIRVAGVDLLHIHDMLIAGAVFRTNRSFLLPTILDLHENRPEIMKHYRHVVRWPGRWLIRPDLWKRKMADYMNTADHVVVVTEQARQQASAESGLPLGKFTALPNVVRLDEVGPSGPPAETEFESNLKKLTADRFTLLYIGDTSVRRGTMTMLEAAERLKNRIPELLLLIVGSGSEDDALRQFVANKGLENQVRFEGWQPPSKLPAYVRASDVGLSPLLRNPHHDTTYANKLFLYMAGGLPTVASDCPAQADLIRQEGCGRIHRAGEADDLADAVADLAENPGVGREMGEKAVRAVRERWNWDKTGGNLIEAYRKIV